MAIIFLQVNNFERIAEKENEELSRKLKISRNFK